MPEVEAGGPISRGKQVAKRMRPRPQCRLQCGRVPRVAVFQKSLCRCSVSPLGLADPLECAQPLDRIPVCYVWL